jgi:2-polyprenyl-3-methyl-5-hydroxy-6-metoxy-1,4-benzoquinol methylase
MQDFQNKEYDIKGRRTLDVFSDADKYNKWIYEIIRPYCKGDIIEIGSGIGNISQILIKENCSVVLTDLKENYCQILKDKFSHSEHSPRILKLDLTHPEFSVVYAGLMNSFDTIVILNVLEHIKDDNQALQNCYSLLREGGYLIVFVPALQCLFNRFDRGLEHYRRYNKTKLSQLIYQNNFEITIRRYMNFVGIIGWFVSGSILRYNIVPDRQIKLYNKLVPVFKVIDKIIFNSIGLGAICVGRKKV